jgi:alkanesulfonate monooxygenase SsuD/methylene tetrahydromethanopterin reductase-like flavin-dependent oxidoreductase (luciferase family)
MQFGYFMMPLHLPGSDPAETLELDLRQVERLDRLGYAEAWIGEHFTAEWENIPAPDMFIAAALQRTERIKFGTGVSCMPNHNPFHLAHRIAQLDQMARGRFLFGVGSGGFPGDFEVVGVDPKTGVQRAITTEVIDAVLQLWEDPTPGAYEGRTWRFNVPEPDARIAKHVYLRPFQKPHPPIGVAGVSERSDTLAMAGERGWIPMSINLASTRVLQTHWDTVEAGAAKTGKPCSRADWRIARNVHVAETDEQARHEAIDGAIGRDFRDYFLPLLAQGRMYGIMKSDPEMPDSEVTPEFLCDTIWVVGSPETVARKLRALYDAVGGFGHLLAIAHDWPDPARWDRSMTLLAEEVMPRLADLDGVAPVSPASE